MSAAHCQSMKSLRRRTPEVRTRMSSGGLPDLEVMRCASMVDSVIDLEKRMLLLV